MQITDMEDISGLPIYGNSHPSVRTYAMKRKNKSTYLFKPIK